MQVIKITSAAFLTESVTCEMVVQIAKALGMSDEYIAKMQAQDLKGASKGKPASWYFITVDYTAGHSMEKDARRAIESGGGKFLGAVRFPLGLRGYRMGEVDVLLARLARQLEEAEQRALPGSPHDSPASAEAQSPRVD